MKFPHTGASNSPPAPPRTLLFTTLPSNCTAPGWTGPGGGAGPPYGPGPLLLVMALRSWTSIDVLEGEFAAPVLAATEPLRPSPGGAPVLGNGVLWCWRNPLLIYRTNRTSQK